MKIYLADPVVGATGCVAVCRNMLQCVTKWRVTRETQQLGRQGEEAGHTGLFDAEFVQQEDEKVCDVAGAVAQHVWRARDHLSCTSVLQCCCSRVVAVCCSAYHTHSRSMRMCARYSWGCSPACLARASSPFMHVCDAVCCSVLQCVAV